MRKAITIKKEISNKETRISYLNEAIPKKRYSETSLDVGSGIILILLLLIGIGLLYWQVLISRNSDNIIVGFLGFVAMAAVFFYSFSSFSFDIAYYAARNFMLIWGMFFFFYVKSAIWFITSFKAVGILDKSLFKAIESGEAFNLIRPVFPVFFANDATNNIVLRLWFWTITFSIISVFMLFLSSLIHFIRESIKRGRCINDVLKSKKEIEDCKGHIKVLENELAATVETGNVIYNGEIKKEHPDEEIIKKAADYGCADAAIRVATDLAKQLIKNKQTENHNNIIAAAKIIREYLDLAEECQEKQMLNLLDIWSDFYIHYANYSVYGQSREILKSLSDKRNKISFYMGNKSETAKLIASDALLEQGKAYNEAKKYLEIKEEQERIERKERARRRQEEEERKRKRQEEERRIWYTGLTTSQTTTTNWDDFDDPVVDSGEVDLSGTSYIDWA